MQTARTTTSESLKRFDVSSVWGSDARHGPHHVAQKSRTRTLPLKSERCTAFPFGSFEMKSGAMAPTSSWVTEEVDAVWGRLLISVACIALRGGAPSSDAVCDGGATGMTGAPGNWTGC